MAKKEQTTGGKQVVKSTNGDVVHILPDGPSIAIFKSSTISPGIGEPATNKTEHKPTDEGDSIPWALWGDDDMFPIQLLRKLGNLGVAQSGIDINADLHYGAGIEWFKKEYVEGKIVHKPTEVKQWDDFVKNTNYLIHHSDALQSLETFYISFFEFILTKDKKQIHSVQCLDTPFCRFKQKNNSGKITHVYFVHDADEGGRKHDVPIPLYDPKNPKAYKKFVVAIKYRCFGMPYYTEPNFYATVRNGWADVAISIPKMIQSIYKNSATIKYVIKIPISALKAKYSNYEELSPEEQIQKQDEYHELLNKALSSEKNAGKSVMTIFDDEGGFEGIEITPLRDYLDKEAELPNNYAANSEILFSMNVDPSLIGFGVPGGKNLSGSGSDKREGRENKQKNLKRERLVSLQLPLVVQQLLPGFPQDVFPMYVDADNSQTLDENPTGSQNVVV